MNMGEREGVQRKREFSHFLVFQECPQKTSSPMNSGTLRPFFFSIDIQLIDNVVLVSGVQQGFHLYTHTHTHTHLFRFFFLIGNYEILSIVFSVLYIRSLWVICFMYCIDQGLSVPDLFSLFPPSPSPFLIHIPCVPVGKDRFPRKI